MKSGRAFDKLDLVRSLAIERLCSRAGGASVSELCVRTRVSTKTIHRDLDHLKLVYGSALRLIAEPPSYRWKIDGSFRLFTPKAHARAAVIARRIRNS